MSQWKFAVLRKFAAKLVLCNNLDLWDGVGGEREVQEGGDICLPRLIHVDVWQKPTQYCKLIIL